MSKLNITDSTIDITFDFQAHDLIANITYSYSYLPAKLDGPWEKCYPTEEEFEYALNDIGFDGLEQVCGLSELECGDIISNASLYLESEQDNHDLVKELALDAYNTGLDYG